MLTVFCGQALVSIESATSGQSASSQCLSALPGRLGRGKFVRLRGDWSARTNPIKTNPIKQKFEGETPAPERSCIIFHFFEIIRFLPKIWDRTTFVFSHYFLRSDFLFHFHVVIAHQFSFFFLSPGSGAKNPLLAARAPVLPGSNTKIPFLAPR